MISVVSQLALWQEVALFGLVLLSIVYVFYFRIWVALATASDLLFALALGVCVLCIAVPQVFDLGAQRAVDWSPLPEALQEADAKVAALESLPSRVIASALEKIGYPQDETDSDQETVEPSSNLGELPSPGPFESRIRPAVESLVSVILRVTSSLASLFLLLMALALRSSTSTARELQAISARLAQVEHRIDRNDESGAAESTA